MVGRQACPLETMTEGCVEALRLAFRARLPPSKRWTWGVLSPSVSRFEPREGVNRCQARLPRSKRWLWSVLSPFVSRFKRGRGRWGVRQSPASFETMAEGCVEPLHLAFRGWSGVRHACIEPLCLVFRARLGRRPSLKCETEELWVSSPSVSHRCG